MSKLIFNTSYLGYIALKRIQLFLNLVYFTGVMYTRIRFV